ncbi:Aluminum-activated malate transporter 2 [Linum perenne]
MKSIMKYFMQSSWLKNTLIKNKLMMGSFMSMVVELARDDPRRVIHSFKVGLAISFVSLFYYCKPLYDDFGVSIMWALMTVVVVSEFSVGATLGKGVIRGMATMLAGALGIGAHHVANRFGHVGERAITGFLVFLLAAVTTFMRFVPNLKARYDSGLLVFILTFSFMSVSGYGDNELLEVVRKRVSTIMIGALVSVVVSMALFPVWAGEDLHDLVAGNLEKLGNFMEGFGNGYFEEEEIKAEDLMLMMEYKSILNSKNNEDSLVCYQKELIFTFFNLFLLIQNQINRDRLVVYMVSER